MDLLVALELFLQNLDRTGGLLGVEILGIDLLFLAGLASVAPGGRWVLAQEFTQIEGARVEVDGRSVAGVLELGLDGAEEGV